MKDNVNKTDEISIKKLEYKNTHNAGKQIHGIIDQKVPCIEYTMSAGNQVLVHANHAPALSTDFCVGHDTFIQFEPKSWSDAMERRER
jgi:hypothetical protein